VRTTDGNLREGLLEYLVDGVLGRGQPRKHQHLSTESGEVHSSFVIFSTALDQLQGTGATDTWKGPT
jgi:hypothetical protein